MNNDYQIFFEAHNQKHKIYIDLECFAKALKPYIVQPNTPLEEKKECECICHKDWMQRHCHLAQGCMCEQVQPSALTDAVEDQIKKIMDNFWNDDNITKSKMYPQLRELVALARKTK